MTLAEWGNPTASFSYCLMRLSTVEIRAGCRLWVTAVIPARPRQRKKPLSPPGTPESGSSAEKPLHSNPRSFHLGKDYPYAGVLFPLRLPFRACLGLDLDGRKLRGLG